MRKVDKRSFHRMIVIVTCLVILAFISLFLGRFTIFPLEVIQIFYQKFRGTLEESFAAQTLFNIRLPRTILAIIVGGGLSAAGAAFQAIFQNRLVSPDILGVSNGAGFGAALAMLLLSEYNVAIIILAFVGGITSVVISYSLSKIKKNRSVLALVLSGIVVASFFNGLISFIKLIADTESTLPSITYWLMGSFAGANYWKIKFTLIFVGIGVGILTLMRWRINILSMGDEEAYTLGINPQKNRLIIVVACTLITASSVTVTGIIGWIGMIIPNICRDFISANNRWLIPSSFLMGSLFMLFVDILARALTPSEIPVGILTAILGAPLFMIIYFREEK